MYEDSEEDAPSRHLLEEIHSTWFLVNVVDNNYVSDHSDVFAIFKRVISDEMGAAEMRTRVDELERANLRLRQQLGQMEQLHEGTARELDAAHEENAQLLAEVARLKGKLRAKNVQRVLGAS